MVQFEGSDVPLEDDILKAPIRQFFPTFAEWSAENREQVVEDSGAASGTDFFTVPVNQTFYLTSCYVSANGSGTGAGIVLIRYGAASTRKVLIHAAFGASPSGSSGAGMNSLNFSKPLKVESGDGFEIVHQNAGNVSVGIQGWIQPKRIS